MNDTPRVQLIHALGELGEVFPDWRFGQLVANVATAARGPTPEAIWDGEDEELLAAARRLLERNRERMQAAASSSGEWDIVTNQNNCARFTK